MTDVATGIGLAIAALTIVLAAVRALRNTPVGRADLALAALLEVAVLLYVVVRIVGLVGGHRPSSVVVVVAYLIGDLLVMPIATALALAERSRWGPVVLGVGALVVCVLYARIGQVWRPHG